MVRTNQKPRKASGPITNRSLMSTPATPAKSSGKTTTTTPYSSEGPTLPIIGAPHESFNAIPASGAVPTANPERGESNKRSTKKRKTDTGSASAHPTTTSTAPRTDNHKANLPLYEPWTLLPAALQTLVVTRLSSFDEQDVIPVVFTRNQNITSGVNKLKAYLAGYPTASPATEEEKEKEKLKKLREGRVHIAVSAQGEATTKLAGIIEMTKRVLKPTDAGAEAGVEEWYMYTSLGSRVEEREKRRKRRDVGEEGEVEEEEEGAFESLADIQEREAQKSTRAVPALTVWMSKVAIPGFKNEFGEETFQVASVKEEE